MTVPDCQEITIKQFDDFTFDGNLDLIGLSCGGFPGLPGILPGCHSLAPCSFLPPIILRMTMIMVTMEFCRCDIALLMRFRARTMKTRTSEAVQASSIWFS